MPALPLTQPDGSTYRFFSDQALGVAVVAANVDFDLTGLVTLGSAALPLAVREDPTFRDNWRIFVRQTDPGITSVSAAVEFLPAAPATPTTLRLVVDSDNIANEADIEFWYLHSVVR